MAETTVTPPVQKPFYGCAEKGFVLAHVSQDEKRKCDEKSCGYLMSHGKCGFLSYKQVDANGKIIQ